MCEWFATDLWFVTEKRPETCEWFAAESPMAISEGKTNHKRQPIILKRLNLTQYVRPIVRSLLSFLF